MTLPSLRWNRAEVLRLLGGIELVGSREQLVDKLEVIIRAHREGTYLGVSPDHTGAPPQHISRDEFARRAAYNQHADRVRGLARELLQELNELVTIEPEIEDDYIVCSQGDLRVALMGVAGLYAVGEPRPRGKQKNEMKLHLARETGRVLREAGVRLSKYPDGIFARVLRLVYGAAGEYARNDLTRVVGPAIDTLKRIHGPQKSVEALRDEALREEAYRNAWRDDPPPVWEQPCTLNGVALHPRVKRLVVLTDEARSTSVSPDLQGPADKDRSMWKQTPHPRAE